MQYPTTVTYVGQHNNLSGIQGGAPGDYYHLTAAEKADILNKVSPSELKFANLTDSPNNNPLLNAQLGNKQNALLGTGLVRSTAGVITYDTNVYLTSLSGPAGGDLSGTYPSPTITSSVVMGKQMTGWNPLYPTGTGSITSSDSLIVAIQKLNATLNSISPSNVSSVSLTMPSSVFSYTNLPASGAVALGASFISQGANKVFAAPDGLSGVPDFRLLTSNDLPNLAISPAGTYGGGSPVQIPVITVDAKGRVTTVTTVTATGTGTVVSVGIDPPTYLTAGSPVTVSGDITLAWSNTISPNTVLAGPSSGVSTAAPIFRPLVSDDIPFLPLTKITGLQDAIANKLDNVLNDGEIWIGNSTNAPEMRSLTQDILITNTGVVTIQPNVVDFSKMQQITGADTSVVPNIPGNLLGRWAAGTGDIQEVQLSGDFNLNVGTGILSLAVPIAPVLNSKGGLITWSQSVGTQVQLPAVFEGRLLITDSSLGVGLKWVEAQGDIEVDPALDGTFNILPGAVTLAKMADLPANTIIGNNTVNPDVPLPLTGQDVTAMLYPFTSTLAGVVPPSGGGTVNFLRADGDWAPAGGTTTNALTIGSGLSPKTTPLTTFDGSSAVTISLNTANANTWSALQTFAANATFGEVSATSGSISLKGSTSGTVSLKAANAAGSAVFTLPTSDGAANEYLKTNGSGQLSWGTPPGGTPGGSTWQFQYNDGAAFAGATNIVSNASADILVTTGKFGIVDSAASPTYGVYIAAPNVAVAGLTWDIPVTTANDIFVGEAFTQTLTNKTLSTGLKLDPVPGSAQKGDMWFSNDTSGTVALLPNPGATKYLRFDPVNNYPEWVTVTFPTGTINAAAQYSVPYYSTAGSADAISGITPPSGTAGTYFMRSYLPSTTAVLPTWVGSTGVAASGLVVLDDTPTIKQPRIGAGSGNGHMHIYRGNTPGGLANYATLAFLSASKTMSIEFDADGYQSQFTFAATANRAYTFPNESGTVVLNAFKTITDGTSSFSASGSDTFTLKSDGTYIGATYNTGAKSVSMDWIGPDIVAPLSVVNSIAYWNAGTLSGSADIGVNKVVVTDATGNFIAATTSRTQLNYLASATGTFGSGLIPLVSGTQGSGSMVFSTSPTITNLLLAAGTNTVPPLQFTNGTNLSSPTAGVVEYDGTIMSATTNTNFKRGTIPVTNYTSGVGTSLTATQESTAQILLPSANDTITLSAGTYFIDISFTVTRGTVSTTSATARLNILGTGNATGTFTGISLSAPTAGGTTGAFSFNAVNISSVNVVTAASTTVSGVYTITVRGILKITGSGTITPQYNLSANLTSAGTASAPNVLYFRIQQIDSQFNTTFGPAGTGWG